MDQKSDFVTLSWTSRATGEANRLVLSRRFLLVSLGVVLAAVLLAVVGTATALRLQAESAALRERLARVEGERAELAERLAAARTEMEQVREGLARVRAEEAKIRSWLGLETDTGEDSATELPAEEGGGKGSLGDVAIDAVSPADRTAQAEEDAAPGTRAPRLLDDVRSLATDLGDLARAVEAQKRSWDAIPAITPVDGEHWISSGFGWRRSPFTGKREFHNGIDMAGRKGTPIVAPADGKVVRVVRDRNLGRSITLDHGNGIRTIFGHLDKVLVKRGQRVKRGDRIATMGSSGRRSTGPHLHYSVKVDGKYVNPKHYLLDRGRVPYPVARAK
ncbi:M23 family metallopeptidase [Deferrisoma sp.]